MIALTGDCSDSVPTIYPGAAEVTGDNIDQSCNGQEICYVDADNDGFRLITTLISSDADCNDDGEGTMSDNPNGECNDTNSLLNGSTVWYKDADGDQMSDGSAQQTCTDPGADRYLLPPGA